MLFSHSKIIICKLFVLKLATNITSVYCRNWASYFPINVTIEIFIFNFHWEGDIYYFRYFNQFIEDKLKNSINILKIILKFQFMKMDLVSFDSILCYWKFSGNLWYYIFNLLITLNNKCDYQKIYFEYKRKYLKNIFFKFVKRKSLVHFDKSTFFEIAIQFFRHLLKFLFCKMSTAAFIEHWLGQHLQYIDDILQNMFRYTAATEKVHFYN